MSKDCNVTLLLSLSHRAAESFKGTVFAKVSHLNQNMLHFCLSLKTGWWPTKIRAAASNWLLLCFVENCYFNAWICPQTAAHILQAPVSAGFFPMGPLGLKRVSILRLSALFTHRERLIQANLIKLKGNQLVALWSCAANWWFCRFTVLSHSITVSKLKYVNVTILCFCVHAAFLIALDDIQWRDNCSRGRKKTMTHTTGKDRPTHDVNSICRTEALY